MKDKQTTETVEPKKPCPNCDGSGFLGSQHLDFPCLKCRDNTSNIADIGNLLTECKKHHAKICNFSSWHELKQYHINHLNFNGFENELDEVAKLYASKQLSFETEYQLQQFREVQKDYFDEDGKPYRHSFGFSSMPNQMLKLINQLEGELKSKRLKLAEFQKLVQESAPMPTYRRGA